MTFFKNIIMIFSCFLSLNIFGKSLVGYLSEYTKIDLIPTAKYNSARSYTENLENLKLVVGLLEKRLGKKKATEFISKNTIYILQYKVSRLSDYITFLDKFLGKDKCSEYLFKHPSMFKKPIELDNVTEVKKIIYQFLPHEIANKKILHGLSKFAQIDAGKLNLFITYLQNSKLGFSDLEIEQFFMKGLSSLENIDVEEFKLVVKSLEKYLEIDEIKGVILKGFTKLSQIDLERLEKLFLALKKKPLNLTDKEIRFLLKEAPSGFYYSKQKDPLAMINYVHGFVTDEKKLKLIVMASYSGFARSSKEKVEDIVDYLQGPPFYLSDAEIKKMFQKAISGFVYTDRESLKGVLEVFSDYLGGTENLKNNLLKHFSVFSKSNKKKIEDFIEYLKEDPILNFTREEIQELMRAHPAGFTESSRERVSSVVSLVSKYIQNDPKAQKEFKIMFKENFVQFTSSDGTKMSDLINYLKKKPIGLSDDEISYILKKNITLLSNINVIFFKKIHQSLKNILTKQEIHFVIMNHLRAFSYVTNYDFDLNLMQIGKEASYLVSDKHIHKILIHFPYVITKFDFQKFDTYIELLRSQGLKDSMIFDLIEKGNYQILEPHPIEISSDMLDFFKKEPLKLKPFEIIRLLVSSSTGFEYLNEIEFVEVLKVVRPYFKSDRDLKTSVLSGFSSYTRLKAVELKKIIDFLKSTKVKMSQNDISDMLKKGATAFVEADYDELDEIYNLMAEYHNHKQIKEIFKIHLTGIGRTKVASLKLLIDFLKKTYHFSHDDIREMIEKISFGYALSRVEGVKELIRVLQINLELTDDQIEIALKESLLKFGLTNSDEVLKIINDYKKRNHDLEALQAYFSTGLYGTVMDFRKMEKMCGDSITPFLREF